MKWKRLTSGPRTIVDALNDLGEFVTRTSPIAGVGIRANEGPQGTLLTARGNGLGGGDQICPLSKLTPTGEPDEYTINAGDVNVAGEHKEVGGPDGFKVTAQANRYLWVECVVVAEVLEGTLTGTITVDPTTIVIRKGNTQTDHLWTPDAPSGKTYAMIGGWDEDMAWQPYGCGGVNFVSCAANTQNLVMRFYRG